MVRRAAAGVATPSEPLRVVGLIQKASMAWMKDFPRSSVFRAARKTFRRDVIAEMSGCMTRSRRESERQEGYHVI